MLLRDSHNDSDVYRKIDAEVGKPFTLSERIKLGGIGSPKLFITESSIDIHNLLVVSNDLKTCNIELRPKGIIVRFRSLLETYALVIPYYKLTIYKGKSEEYGIYRDHYFIKVTADTMSIRKFFKKILNQRIAQSPTPLDQL